MNNQSDDDNDDELLPDGRPQLFRNKEDVLGLRDSLGLPFHAHRSMLTISDAESCVAREDNHVQEEDGTEAQLRNLKSEVQRVENSSILDRVKLSMLQDNVNSLLGGEHPQVKKVVVGIWDDLNNLNSIARHLGHRISSNTDSIESVKRRLESLEDRTTANEASNRELKERIEHLEPLHAFCGMLDTRVDALEYDTEYTKFKRFTC